MISKLFEKLMKYSKPDVSELLEQCQDGMHGIKELPEDWTHYPTINLLEMFFKSVPGFSYELVDDSGQWKYGIVDIKEQYLDGRGQIHLAVGNDFFEKNLDNPADLAKILRYITVHEDTHRQQYQADPNMWIDEDIYYEDPHEIDAHAREAAEELIDLEVNVNDDPKEWAMNSDTVWRYWEDYGRDAEEYPEAAIVWNDFLDQIREYINS